MLVKAEWPLKFLTELRDEKGVIFGFKSTLLESIGILLPFIVGPEDVSGKHLVFHVDNMAVVHGWKNGGIKFDRSASEVLNCVQFLSAEIGSRVFVEHIPRMANEMASLADELSRKEKPTDEFKAKKLEEVEFKVVSGSLNKWLTRPAANFGLCRVLLSELKLRMNL